MLKDKLKKFIGVILSVSLLPTVTFVKNAEAAVTDYLKDTDIIIISPAENRTSSGGRDYNIDAHGWSLTVQNNNSFNGDDVQMYHYGVSDKFRVWDYDRKSGYSGAFRLCAVNWRETPSKRFVDVEGKSKKNGANVHVWAESGDNNAKWFQIVADGDSDPETFYIKNINSNKYLAPENYFDTKNTSYDHRQCLAEGKNTVLSDDAFLWRIEVINRTPDSVKKQREWMSKLNPAAYLSSINIPGVHDAATANVEGSWNEGYNGVACQKYFIPELLEVGVRAFDLRMLEKDKGDGTKELIMLHGSEWAVCHTPDTYNDSKNLTFDMVMGYFKDYLAKHPGETIIAIFKNDGGNSDATNEAFKKVIDKYSDIMYAWTPESSTGNGDLNYKVPVLNDVRGKVVGFSRMQDYNTLKYGLNVVNWDDAYDSGESTEGQLITKAGRSPEVYIQDNYNSQTKISFWDLMDTKDDYVYDTVAAANDRSDVNNLKSAAGNSFLFNYTSCQIASIVFTPLETARELNEYIRTDRKDKNFHSFIKNKSRLGITMMDFADAQLAKMIYSANGTSSSLNASLLSDENQSVYEGKGYKLTVNWPTTKDLMYGYPLSKVGFEGGSAEVTLNDESGNPVSYGVDGEFVFKDNEQYPSVSDSGTTVYKLTFVPIDKEFPVLEKDITITVNKRPISIYVGDYEQQYGDTVDNWRDMVAVSGCVAEKDRDEISKIKITIEKDQELHSLTTDGGIRIADVLPADLPVGSSGTVSIAYEDRTAADFPNYDMDIKPAGTWKIVPRQLTVEWSGKSHYLTDEDVNVTAEIGNIYNNEDVRVEISTVKGETVDGVTEYTATANLTGENAGNYAIPESLESFTYTVSDTAKVVDEPVTRLSETTVLYDGTEKTPDVSLYDDGVLIPSDEYTVAYSNNTDVGVASVTITDNPGGAYELKFCDKSGKTVDNITKSFNIESVENIDVTSDMSGKLTAEKTVKSDGSVQVKLIGENLSELPPLQGFSASYNEDGTVDISIKDGVFDDGGLKFNVLRYGAESGKFFIWSNDMIPFIIPIQR